MYNIDKLNSISKLIFNYLDEKNFKVAENTVNPDAVLVRSAVMHEYAIGDNLLAVARAGAGVNNIPLPKMADKGVVVFNTPGANANAVKELVIAAMLISNRNIIGGAEWAMGLKGAADAAKQVESGKKAFEGPEIFGKTLGLVGLGAIGGLVANNAIDLGMNVIGYDPYISAAAKAALKPEVKLVDKVEELYAAADYVSVHVPLMDSTRNTINKDTIALMKDGVRIINCARGELVNNADVTAALESGKVAKYVTDFPNGEIIGAHANVIAIPHLGASTPEAEDNCAIMAARQLKEYLVDGNIVNAVTYPCLSLARSGKARTCVLTKDVENLGDIVNALAPFGISGSAFKVRGAYGYAIVDTENVPTDAVINTITAVKVRVLA